MWNLADDLRFVGRSLARRPLVIVAAVLSLALAMGAATALFSIANQVVLRLLPVKDPQRLVLFGWRGEFIGGTTRGLANSFSYPAFLELQQGNPGVFTGVAAQYQETADVRAQGPAQRAVAELVSGNYFAVLGVRPELGRTLTAEEDRVRDGEPYVVLSDRFWRGRFGGDPSILNRVIEVNGHAMTVVGVMASGFGGFDRASPSDVFVPLAMKTVITPMWDDRERRNSIWLHIFGRLAPGVTAQQAAAGMAVAYRRVLEQDLSVSGRASDFATKYVRDTLRFAPAAKGRDDLAKQFAKPLYVLLGMVGLLVLIACVNIANLLITRAAMRQKEIAVRLSLGATRASIVRLILTESAVIAVAGGALGLLLASWMVHLLAGLLPYDNLVGAIEAAPDGTVLAFTAGVTMLTALLFGLTPALRATRPNMATVLKSEGSAASLGMGQTRLRRVLVSGQVALSLVLLFAAGLFARNLRELMNVNTGMKVAQVLEFSVDPSLHEYAPERARTLFADLQQRIARVPGVQAVSAAAYPVLANDNWQNTVNVEGHESREGEDMNPGFNQTLPGFFGAMGAPLLAGRDFSERDRAGAPLVAIVNEEFVKRYVGPGRSAVGLHFGLGGGGAMNYEIVGVVRDIKGGDLREKAKPYTYMAALQWEKPASMTYYVRVVRRPSEVIGAMRKVLGGLDRALPMNDVKTLQVQIEQTQFIDVLYAWLSSAFGLLATLLAAVGLYGVTAYAVARRTQEIGIRMALGAEDKAVFRMILREVLALTIAGIVVAAPLVYWVAKIAAGVVFGVKTNDPVGVVVTVLVILLVSLAAGFVPARRATKIDPIRALRYE